MLALETGLISGRGRLKTFCEGKADDRTLNTVTQTKKHESFIEKSRLTLLVLSKKYLSEQDEYREVTPKFRV